MKRKLFLLVSFFSMGFCTIAQIGKKNSSPENAIEFSKLSEYFLLSDPDSALLYSLEGLEKAAMDGDETGQQYCNGSLASYLINGGIYTKALHLLDSNIVFSEFNNDNILKIKTCRRKAALYSMQNKQKDAGKQIQKALDLLKQNDIPEEKKLCNAIAALINYRAGKLEPARGFIETAAKSKKTPGFDGWVELLYGQIEKKMNNKIAALTHYQNAVAILSVESNFKHLAEAYNSIAAWWDENGNADSASFYAKQTIDLATSAKYDSVKIESSRLLAGIENKKTVQAIDAKEAELAAFKNLSNNEKALKLANEEIRKRWTLIMLGGLALLSLSIIILIWKNRQRRKVNLLLEEQKSELQTALADLKTTQMQLIQSEKMASLGELTAGIAHEIQNPLNFVNNFSEVNAELIGEMRQEIEKGNTGEVIKIAENIRQNQEKITHHGKRADGIVKGMLQHSRASTGQKELTDINTLADEYLRLAYHGLRAKDKTFSAKYTTDLDPSMPKLTIIAPDMGRVILNIITNAFYSVTEKKKKTTGEYEPVVSVSTKKIQNRVEIRIKDNGNGIPQHVVNKIYQPFFTTKPTGQGTGLGLSLSYDIITKGHAGELKVETQEGEYAEFIISLPYKS